MTQEEAHDLFLNGGCAAFAYALWEAAEFSDSLRFGVLSCDYGEPFDDICPFDPTHIYVDGPEFEMDVAGRRTLDEMAEDLNLTAWTHYGPYSFHELGCFAGDPGDPDKAARPIDLNSADLEAARAWIAAHPDLYAF